MTTPIVRLDRLIEYWGPELQRAFVQAIQNIRDNAQLNDLIAAIVDNDAVRALQAVNLDPANYRPFDVALSNAFEAGGNATAAAFPLLPGPGGVNVVFQFNMRNPQAEQWLSQYSSQLVTEITADQRSMIQQYIADGIAAGDNPRTIALDLVGRIGADGTRQGGIIGLTQSQMEWVQNYSDALQSDNPLDALTYSLRDARFDGTVQTAFETNEPLTADQIDSMVTAYTNRALRYRAETIGRTEAITALHEAQQQSMEQAVDSGLLSKEQVSWVWRTALDDRVRDSHVEMEGQVVPMGQPFVTGNGYLLEYPGDPTGPPEEIINCRCWREPNVDFLAGIL